MLSSIRRISARIKMVACDSCVQVWSRYIEEWMNACMYVQLQFESIRSGNKDSSVNYNPLSPMAISGGARVTATKNAVTNACDCDSIHLPTAKPCPSPWSGRPHLPVQWIAEEGSEESCRKSLWMRGAPTDGHHHGYHFWDNIHTYITSETHN